MRAIFLFFAVIAFATSANAEDHGHIAIQIKTPAAGCKFLKLNFIDEQGKKYSPNGNTIGMSEIVKAEQKKRFTDIHMFHVKPGRHTLEGINCINFEKNKMTTTINFETLSSSQLPAGITLSNLVFDMVADKTIYLGALDFVPFDRDRTWPLALDRSEEAVKAGRLEAGAFSKQFVTMNGDIASARNAATTASSVLGGGLLPSSGGSEKPLSGGKGEIAIHTKGMSCSELLVFFKNVDKPDAKSLKIKVKKTYKNGEGFATEKAPSGRYKFLSTKCTNGNRYQSAPALAKSFVDVHANEIAYAGEIHQESSFSIGGDKQINTKYRYKFNNDKFEAAKSEVKKPERLVDRSSTMTDTAQLAISGIENYLERTNAKWGDVLTAYDARLSEYSGETIP